MAGAPVLLVTSSYRGRHNALPVAYAMVLSIVPPLIGIAIHPSRHSYDVIRKTEEFAINIPTRELLHHVQYLGSVSGAELGKLELTKLPTFRARRVSAPLLEGCVGWIECGVEDSYKIGDHTLFVGKVAAASAEKDAFDGTWLLADPDERPLHYLGVNYYAILGERLEARIPQPADIMRDVEAGAAELGDEEEMARRREEEAHAAEERERG